MYFAEIRTQQSPHIAHSVAIHDENILPAGIFKMTVPELTEEKNAGEIVKIGNECYVLLHESASIGETEIIGSMYSIQSDNENSN